MSVKYGSRTDQKRLSEVAQIRRITAKRSNHRFESFDDVHPEGIRSADNLDLRTISDDLLQALLGCSTRLNEPNHEGGRSRARNDIAGFAPVEDSHVKSSLAKDGIVTPVGGCALLQSFPQSFDRGNTFFRIA